ncbi:MAG TPA: nickel insertion protein, partial [Ornithinimicrobium sp.]|nr:nickel insertion protein [Ornithinimicrobium sp.]
MERHGWVDASAGVAGDMLLGALLDAGADLSVVRAAVGAVLPGEVELRSDRVLRSGLAAVHVRVAPTGAPPVRSWADLRDLLSAAPLVERVRTGALATFSLLARV